MPVAATLPVWRDARDTTGQQIGALQLFLKGTDLSLYEKIADAGLNGVTDGELTKMQAALMGFAMNPGEATAAKARKAAANMRVFLNDNPVLPLLERNPFGVTVAVRATLGTALDRIERIVG